MWLQQRRLVFPFIGDERGHHTLALWKQQRMARWRLECTLIQRDGNAVWPRVDANSLPETL